MTLGISSHKILWKSHTFVAAVLLIAKGSHLIFLPHKEMLCQVLSSVLLEIPVLAFLAKQGKKKKKNLKEGREGKGGKRLSGDLP